MEVLVNAYAKQMRAAAGVAATLTIVSTLEVGLNPEAHSPLSLLHMLGTMIAAPWIIKSNFDRAWHTNSEFLELAVEWKTHIIVTCASLLLMLGAALCAGLVIEALLSVSLPALEAVWSRALSMASVAGIVSMAFILAGLLSRT